MRKSQQKKVVSAKIDPEIFSKINGIANLKNQNISEIVRLSISEFVNKNEKNEHEEMIQKLADMEIRLTDRIGKYKIDSRDSLVKLNDILQKLFDQEGGTNK